MYVVCVTVFVTPGFEEDFIRATYDNYRHTREEKGNLRFDVSRSSDEANRFFLYEVYQEQADFTAHQQTRHYLKWKETVAQWMQKPREGIKHQSLFPENEAPRWISNS